MERIEIIWILGLLMFLLFWLWLDRRFVEMIVSVRRLEQRIQRLENHFMPKAPQSRWFR